MRVYGRSLIALAGTAVFVSACATSGALRRADEQQQAALASQQQQQQAALAAERAERAASDSSLRQDLGMVRGDLQSLRADLQSLRTDFGAKISAMEDGLKFDMPVNFNFDVSTVRDADHPLLDRFSHVVQKYYPGSKVTIEGFADPAGSARYNLNLSARRATAVRDYLVSQGLAADQLKTAGYGETRLVTPHASKDQPGADLNRRVVFVIESRGTTAVAAAADQPAVPDTLRDR